MQAVRLVLLVLKGPRQGENDFIEFPSIDEAVTYGREICGDPQFQLEEIENVHGRMLVCYEELNDRCREPELRQRRYG